MTFTKEEIEAARTVLSERFPAGHRLAVLARAVLRESGSGGEGVKPGDVFRDLAPGEADDADPETGWLIGDSRGLYLGASCGEFKWVSASDAIRLARRADADTLATVIGEDAESVTEHSWPETLAPIQGVGAACVGTVIREDNEQGAGADDADGDALPLVVGSLVDASAAPPGAGVVQRLHESLVSGAYTIYGCQIRWESGRLHIDGQPSATPPPPPPAAPPPRRRRRGVLAMGLSCSHDAWSGAYGAFGRFREELARAAGGGTKPCGPAAMEWTFDDEVLPAEHIHGFSVLMSHSDCGGEISTEDCSRVAAALEWIAPRLPDHGEGHLWQGYRAAALRFARGCRAAADAGEPVEFH